MHNWALSLRGCLAALKMAITWFSWCSQSSSHCCRFNLIAFRERPAGWLTTLASGQEWVFRIIIIIILLLLFINYNYNYKYSLQEGTRERSHIHSTLLSSYFQSWAMPDYSVTSQRYRIKPWCRNTDAGLRQLTPGRNADAGITLLRHSDIPAFTYDFLTFHFLQFGRALHGYSFYYHQH
jgi:hypothetical protein